MTKIKDRPDQVLMKMYSKWQHSQAAGGSANWYKQLGKLIDSMFYS